ncbi:MAG: hypothetical protein R3335_00020 [Anaerolineales bacterium]|nr:hypothetical protein [Anaerolineales bacterium]
MKKKLIFTLLGAFLFVMVGAACAADGAGQSGDEFGVVYRSPT